MSQDQLRAAAQSVLDEIDGMRDGRYAALPGVSPASREALRAALAAPEQEPDPSVYNLKRIGWELERTAMGDGYYGNALYVALDIPGVTEKDRQLLHRYLTGGEMKTDHIALQDLAMRIYKMEPPAPQSQPIARVTGYYGGNCVIEPLDGKTVSSSGMAVYSAPVAAQAAQPDPWISVKDAMPKSGVIVLAYYINSHNHSRRIRAKWTAAKTEEANAEFDWGEYDEETDTYWTPEGWYECTDNWDEFSSIMVSEGEITHWMPLPLAPDDPNYTAPPSREWQSLTDEERHKWIDAVVAPSKACARDYQVAAAIASALRAKNTWGQA